MGAIIFDLLPLLKNFSFPIFALNSDRVLTTDMAKLIHLKGYMG